MYSVVMMMALTGGAEVPDWGWRRCCGCCGGVVVRHWGWRHGCWGCCGCGGGCYGCSCYCSGCVGCVGCVGCAGCVGVAPTMPSADSMAFVPDGISFYPRPGPFLVPNGDVQNVNFQNSEARPAIILVTVPENTKVTFNGWTSSSNSTKRRFKTPALQPGKDYAYTLRAEIIRDGQTLVRTHQVVVRAGQETEATIRFPQIALSQFEDN